jgi:hypothetical protein
MDIVLHLRSRSGNQDKMNFMDHNIVVIVSETGILLSLLLSLLVVRSKQPGLVMR